MKNEIKILKFIQDHNDLKAKEICNSLNINYEESMPVFRHLENQRFITLIRGHGRIGPLMHNTDPFGITTNGVKHLENRIPNFVKSYLPIFISIVALLISIIAFTK